MRFAIIRIHSASHTEERLSQRSLARLRVADAALNFGARFFESFERRLDVFGQFLFNAIAEFGDDRSVRLLANEITLMEDVRSSMPAPTRIKVLAEEENDAKQRIWRIMQGPAGRQPQDLQNDELRLYARDQEGNVHAVAKLTVRADQRLLQALRREFGDQNVKEERIKVQ